jgi:hypothetical protein
MANEDTVQELTEAMYFVAGAIALVAALGVMTSYSHSAAETAQAATRHSAHAATLDLATTANSAMLILGGQSNQSARTSKSVKRMLRALKLRLDQAAGAPVVT